MNDTNTIIKDIQKTFGKNIVRPAQHILDKPRIVIPFSPKLDMIIGGVPEGSFVVIAGPPKIGKTLSALHLCGTAQKKEHGGELAPNGRDLFILNIEGRLHKRDLVGHPDIDMNRTHVIGSKPGNILTAQNYLTIGEKIIREIPGSILLFDSFSTLCTEEEMNAPMDKMQRADGAKLLYKFCRKISNIIPINNNIVIGINHMMGNPGAGMAETKEKGGYAVKYQADVHLHAKWKEEWKNTAGDHIGLKVHWKCVTSPITPPGGTEISYIRFGIGIDEIQELIEISIDLGLIKQGGAWYTVDFVKNKEKPKFQGMEKLRQGIIDMKLTEMLNTKINKMLN